MDDITANEIIELADKDIARASCMLRRLSELNAAEEAVRKDPIEDCFNPENPYILSDKMADYCGALDIAARALMAFAAGRWGIHNLEDAYRVIRTSRGLITKHKGGNQP